MTPSKILFLLCIAFIAGVAMESAIKIPQSFLWVFLFLLIIATSLSFLSMRENYAIVDFSRIAIFCLFFVILGVLRMQIAEFNIKNDKLSQFIGKEVILTGAVISEPDVREKSQMLKIKTDGFNSKILVTTRKYPEFKYLDRIKLSGMLEEPGGFLDDASGLSYKNYLAKDGIYSAISFPKLEKLGKRPTSIFSRIFSGILFFKQKLRDSIRQNFLPPNSSILEGTVLGNNGAMSNDLKNKLNATGLRHIIAVSGTHVIILSSILMAVLLALGFWRGQAFYIAIVFLAVYIVLTGLPASGIRAGIMGGLYLLAQKLGRQSMGPRAITMACAAMLFINPLYLFYDIGFQLSFFAVLGLIYLEPIIKYFLRFSVISMTLAAQIFTLPILVYNFGNISLVSPITNFLVSPVVEALMVFGFLASFAGIFSNFWGWIFSVPAYFVLQYFIFIINLFSQPWATTTVENAHWAWLVVFYILLIIFTRYLHSRFKRFII